ncbi:MAG: response regulator [Lachnospiraceae bacterium]|nr:response regulator [Lachnospiraceae bacterium]
MGEAKIKVLIVDDSAIARGIFEKAFNNTQKFQVVGMVSNGRKAVDFCKENEVHLVVTDYDMPEMNGIEETRILAKELGKPVCIYSEDNSIKTDALEAGAMLFQIKPSFSSFSSQGMVLFIKKIEDSIKNENIAIPVSEPAQAKEIKTKHFPSHSFKILCIGASTGGPTAVQTVLKGLGSNFPLPILYVQHIDIGSDLKMVNWFKTTCPNIPMELAKDGQIAQNGHVYMAPADKHLVIDFINKEGKPVLKLSDEPPERFLKPAVNKLFRSAAALYEKQCLAVLLTGMGRDGAEGCKEIVDKGGCTIVEDKSTCAVFGMPAAAIELEAATKILPRGTIATEILQLI